MTFIYAAGTHMAGKAASANCTPAGLGQVWTQNGSPSLHPHLQSDCQVKGGVLRDVTAPEDDWRIATMLTCTQSMRTSTATKGIRRSASSCPMICPTRPKPAMMTCPRSSSVCPSVACSACEQKLKPSAAFQTQHPKAHPYHVLQGQHHGQHNPC